MRHLQQLLFTTALLLILSARLFALGGGVSGRVLDESNRPLAGVHVALPDIQRGCVTDESGRFFLAGLPEGPIRMRITHVGYRAFEFEIQSTDGTINVLPDVRLTATAIDLGEVSVSSTRSDELMRNVPQPISATAAGQLLRQPLISIPDALDAQPGVALVRDGAWGTDVSIRGLSRGNIVTIVDGARIETASSLAAGLSLVDISDVDRVEVIRGAASTLYGSGATGGVVNIMTAAGSYGDGLRMSGAAVSGYSSANNGGTGSLTLDAGDSRWYARAHGQLRSADDTRTPVGPLKDSQFHDRSVSASAGVRLWEGHELNARYQLVEAQDAGIPGGSTFAATASARYTMASRELFTAAYSAPMLLPDMQKLTLRYVHQLIERDVEIVANPTTTLRPSAEHFMDGVQLHTAWIPLSGHRLAAGIDAWQRRYTGRRLRELKARNTVIADLPLPDASFRSIGAYAQDEFALFDDGLRVTLGGRADLIDVWNDEAFDLLYTEVNGVRNDAPPNRVLRWQAAEYSEVSWSAHTGLIQRLGEKLDITFNLSRSWRAPALEERYQYIELGGATYIGDPGLKAEKGTCVDLGLRLRENRLSVSANVFVNYMRDLVVDQRVLDTLYVKQNVGEARLTGFELVSEYSPASQLSFYGSLSYVRGEDTGNGGDLPSIPPMTLRTGVRYSPFDALHIDVRATMTADQDRVAVGEDATRGAGTIDILLRSSTLRFAGVGVQLFAGLENVFDRAYTRHLSTLRGIVNLEPGRNFFARVRVLW